ncbi:hypothetical protein C9I86_07740 [Photobacterium sp. NCIMB 13483]|uniref:Uncharacterized protein n=1 Tax=Photobacterium piscicola TaxID=1378299 RepID=A0A1T5HXQ6_9GAMM|nr:MULTISPECIES: hypothetical protein [Photobacterium]MEC6823307.1 hypothetical protein [Photobacterium piscicola]MEC6882994.1 hypothetical protein [Photobacterium piscicola]MEC6898248.1 hypothetical protein [Photobacterium piscicola]PST91515.1 hypothetical protein C9I86_07740 [Photobacterium sp. NCIMB 13483]SKC31598.1 hypothetical protein CZ809_01100 [Photobacterium piscicola]
MLKQGIKIKIVSIGVGILILPWLPLLISQYSFIDTIKDAIGGIAFTLGWGMGVPAGISYGIAIVILLLPMIAVYYGMKRILTPLVTNEAER